MDKPGADEHNLMDAVDKTLGFGSGDGMEVFVEGHRMGFTRFSNERITQNLSRSKFVMTVKACIGAREGISRTTDFSPESLEALVRTAEEIALSSRENLEYTPPIQPAQVPAADSYHENTVLVGPRERAAMVKRTIERCAGEGHTCAGMLGNGTLFRAFGNSNGHKAFYRGSWARMTCTVMTDDSSGWKRSTAENIADIDPDEVFEEALEKAEKSRHPAEIEPGRYVVVLDSPAVSEMLGFMFWCYDAKSAHEGRSFMSSRMGSRIADARVNISTQPGHPMAPGFPFQPDGLPNRPIKWIENGRSVNLVRDRFWARKLGLEPTGYPTNFVMEGTESSVDDIVSTVDRGILVSRFWYVRYVDQMEMLLTGMTRDGTFLIENGRISTGVKNMRWNDSALRVLDSVRAVGKPAREGETMDTLVPPIVVDGFNFTSKTLF